MLVCVLVRARRVYLVRACYVLVGCRVLTDGRVFEIVLSVPVGGLGRGR